MIKCRIKKIAKEGAEILNKKGIFCYTDDHLSEHTLGSNYNGLGYNIIGFKSSEEEDKAFEILENLKGGEKK